MVNVQVIRAVTVFLVIGSAVVLSGVAVYRVGGQYGERFSSVEKSIRRSYDLETGQLRVIAFDRNHNGTMDSWTYYTDSGRMSRTEADDDENGTIDHWFYYDDDESIVKMGFSTRDDGVPDAWWYDGPESGTHRIEYVDRQAGSIIRTEYYGGERLVRVEVPSTR